MFRKNFLFSSFKLILLGVAIGFLARYIVGDPVPPAENGRRFTSPIDRANLETVDDEVPDFPLPEDWSSD